VPNAMEFWEPKPPGTLWITPGLIRDSFTFIFTPLAGKKVSAFVYLCLFIPDKFTVALCLLLAFCQHKKANLWVQQRKTQIH